MNPNEILVQLLNVATVWLYVFPYRSHFAQWIRSFLPRLSSTLASSESLKELGVCVWEFWLMVHLNKFTYRHHTCSRPSYLSHTARVSSGGVSAMTSIFSA
jgi:hypothetical protein